MKIIDNPDEVNLKLLKDHDHYAKKEFCLEITTTEGKQIGIHLDGIMVGDIIADAKNCGMPIESFENDGIIRRPGGNNEE